MASESFKSKREAFDDNADQIDEQKQFFLDLRKDLIKVKRNAEQIRAEVAGIRNTLEAMNDPIPPLETPTASKKRKKQNEQSFTIPPTTSEEEEEEDPQHEIDDEDQEISTREVIDLTQEEEDFKLFCEQIAGRLQVPLSEIWHHPSSSSASVKTESTRVKVEASSAHRPTVDGKEEDELRAKRQAERDRIRKSYLDRLPDYSARPVPAAAAAAAAVPSTTTAIPRAPFAARSASHEYAPRRIGYFNFTVNNYLTSSALSAMTHVLFLIRSLNNPAVSSLNLSQLMARHPEMLISWISLMIKYERNFAGESVLYKTRHALHALSHLMEQHRAYFSKIR